MIKTIIATVSICGLGTFALTTHVSHEAFFRGYKYGYQEGADVVRSDVDLILSRPWAKRNGPWKKKQVVLNTNGE